ncbi:hypothetical protein ASPZODRAFT_128234 [Penicilliopsis zonata CBS 506.65]|uniref:Nuclear pore complex protein n=1 Tax=Penicilliopsis zonata CBS 506.65 TaxID=1073090 RepID=A0A1L9SRL9_9EURO|nr:hypothetical protein ASPZODRAFT_128234 [Penicilliopsis zonata CBS 506.65]OJJ49721.1 hypothetical protein ASPZODRAFT_128234 [Penicilliopsis zonata CBS 506.65]
MAPLTRAAGPMRDVAPFTAINATARRPAQNDPEIIEIDDEEEDRVETEEEPTEEEEYTEEDGEDEAEETEETEEDQDEDMESASGSSEEGDEVDSVFEGANLRYARSDREMTTPELFTSAGAQQALHPLRRTADRVTRQIQAFAEKLDQFKQKGSRADDFNRYQAAWNLARSYRLFAQDAINEISKQSTLKRSKFGWSASLSNGVSTRNDTADAKTEEELQRLQLEHDTWYLLQDIVSANDPSRRAHAKQAQESVFQRLHRYSSDREVWEGFLEADHYATECVIALKWLEHTSKTSSSDLDLLIDELETQADRGQGVWSHGWLYTKESIKGQKRLRAWPRPLEPNDPGIMNSLLNSEKNAPLITQLDPDAITRQKQTLQKQDQFSERATWLSCWKMLREGESWTTIRNWAQERLESWRAVSLCGSTVEPSHKGEKSTDKTPLDDGLTRMMNFRSQDSWRAACSALARNPHAEDFERAVYSLLCGETEAAYRVCQSWDDYLYVYFNSLLLSRYQNFCKQFRRKLSLSPASPVAFVPEPAGHQDLQQFLQHTKDIERIGVEARNPYRTIQAAILGHGYDGFFLALARAVSKMANSDPEQDSFIPNLSPSNVDDSMLIAAQDQDALRIAAHLYIITSALGYVRADTQFFEQASVSVMGYVANLESMGLYDFIPLYGSLLPIEMAHTMLGQVIIEVVDPRERRKQVKLIEKYRIDVEAVLTKQWLWISSQVSEIDHPRTVSRYPKVLRRKDVPPEIIPVKKDFIGMDISPEDDRLIRSLEWLRYVDGQWGKICQLGALLYRNFYLTGRLAAARELSKRMPLPEISRESFGFDIDEVPLLSEEQPEDSPTETLNPTGEGKNLILRQATPMRDLERLIVAFEALEVFAVTWEEFSNNARRRDSSAVKDHRARLTEALENVRLTCETIFETAEFLPVMDESVQAEQDEIKVMYIPELVLEYHSTLYYAAHALSSEILVDCLNLSVVIATTAWLTEVFVGARRMAELADVFALSSVAMVNTGRSGKPRKRFATGETLGIWDVEVQLDDDFVEAMASQQ